jgi:hypothetical protein
MRDLFPQITPLGFPASRFSRSLSLCNPPRSKNPLANRLRRPPPAFVCARPRSLYRLLRNSGCTHFAHLAHACARHWQRWPCRWRCPAAACSAAAQAEAVVDLPAVAEPEYDSEFQCPGREVDLTAATGANGTWARPGGWTWGIEYAAPEHRHRTLHAERRAPDTNADRRSRRIIIRPSPAATAPARHAAYARANCASTQIRARSSKPTQSDAQPPTACRTPT